MANSDRPIAIPLALLPFRVDGDAIGTVRRLELTRSSPETVSGVRLTVRLEDSTAAARLRHCSLTMREFHALGSREGFTCASAADSAAGRLEQVGEVTLEPGGETLPIVEPARQAAQWRSSRYDTSAAKAELAALQAETLAAAAARAVTIHADSSRAVIDIRGDRPLLSVHADSNGASLRIRGPSGADVFRLHADSNGASVAVPRRTARGSR